MKKYITPRPIEVPCLQTVKKFREKMYYQYRDYLQRRYGEVLYRVPLDAGFTCPHRRRDGSGGCTFCPPDGARAVQLGDAVSLEEQIERGVRFARRRYHATAFMAYLQAFTTTFRSREELRALVTRITAARQFRAIAFGVRPDCLPPQVIEWLAELQQEGEFDISAELGVQTASDDTLRRVHRGHDWNCSRDAIERLAAAGISVTAHLIIGLPGESRADWLRTVSLLSALPVTALKLHNLHVITNTELAREWQAKPFPLLNEYDYIEELLAILPQIPAHIPLLRLTTDTPDDQLLAPRWDMSKGQFRKALARQMAARGVAQGSALRTASPETITLENGSDRVITDDGSPTFYNSQVKEHYHTLAGARSEAELKYVVPGRLHERLTTGPVRLLDICFGLGYNSLLACETALAAGGKLEIIALEMDKTVVRRAAAELSGISEVLEWNKVLDELLQNGFWQHEGISITILWGDARHTAPLPEVQKARFNLIWLDAFSTQKNSELWTVDFFRHLHPLLTPDGTLLTYSAAIPVRSGLTEAGFVVGETAAFGRDRGGTLAALPGGEAVGALPERDIFLMGTLRGVPYRDPNGVRTCKEILRAREGEILQRKKLKET
jgi:radical SAM protein (TIGR01212 family)